MVKIEYTWHTDTGTQPAVFYATSVDSFHKEKQQDNYVFGKDYTINTITHTEDTIEWEAE